MQSRCLVLIVHLSVLVVPQPILSEEGLFLPGAVAQVPSVPVVLEPWLFHADVRCLNARSPQPGDFQVPHGANCCFAQGKK